MSANNEIKEILKSNFGMSAEQTDKVSPGIIKVMEKIPELSQYELEAEVLSSSFCSVNMQPGNKFVFSAMPIVLNIEKSTATPCMRAIGVLTPFLNGMVERIISGMDPNECVWHIAECMDTGLENGGLGKVRFRITANKN